MDNTFVPIHVHSMYSRLQGGDGLCFPSELAERAAEIGCPALALTDHGTMAGLAEFYDACKKANIKPLLGMEGYITPMGHTLDERVQYDIKELRGRKGYVRNNYHLILIVKNETGWKNLCAIHKEMYDRGFYYKPRFDHEILEKYHEGLICSSACILGEVSNMCWCDDYERAKEIALWYKNLFGDDYYLEVMYHGLDMEKKALEPVRRLGRELGIKVIATNDSHYATKGQHKLHKALMLDKMHKSFGDSDVSGSFFDDDDSVQNGVEEDGGESNPIFETSSELYIKDYDEMVECLSLEGGGNGQIQQELANTIEIAEKCNYELPIIDPTDMSAYHTPVYPVERDLQYDDFVKANFEIKQSTKDAIIKEMKADGREGDELEDFLNEHEMLSLRFLMWMCDKGIKENVVPKLEARGEALPMEYWCKNPSSDFKITHTHNSPDEIWIKGQIGEGKTVEDMIQIYQDRVDYEVSVVVRKGFIDYFSIVQNYANFTKLSGSFMGPGRGSGGGSLLLYLLSITSIDPIVHSLLFFRFLNPDRKGYPDVDLDWSAEFRDNKLKPYLREFYGEDHCAGVATYMYYWGKAAIKASARILFTPPDSVEIGETLADALDDKPKLDLKVELTPGVNPAFVALVNSNLKYKQVIDLALQIQGRLSGESIHASAFIVSPHSLTDKIPQTVSKNERVRAQKEGTPITDRLIAWPGTTTQDLMGYVKLDLLCVVDLEMMEMASKTIERIYGMKIDLEKIPLDDAAVWNMLNDNLVSGIFQLDGSAGMAEVMEQVHPESIENINAIVALYRPGPMDYIPNYVEGKNHPENIHYLDPRLEPILKDTYSVVCYQEQAMLITQAIGNFTGGEADAYRKAAAKKHPEQLVPMGEKFVRQAIENDTDPDVAAEIWEQLVKFGSYAFNRSHSAAYALIAYRGAFLKAHFPECFLSALCTLKPKAKKINKVPSYLEEARQMGIIVKPPHVNYSMENFDVPEKGVIAFGLSGIKGVGNGASPVIAEREANGPYKDFTDFCTRVPKTVGKSPLEAMIKAGALDGLGWSRKAMEESIEQIVEFRKKYFREQQQMELFSDDLFGFTEEEGPSVELVAPFETEYTERELMAREKEMFGMYFGAEPRDFSKVSRFMVERELMTAERERVKAGDTEKPCYVPVTDISSLPDKTPVIFIANVGNVKEFTTSKGSKMANITVWDNGFNEESRYGFAPAKATIKLTVFSRTWAAMSRPRPDDVIIVKGRVSVDKEGKWPTAVLVDMIEQIAPDAEWTGKNAPMEKLVEYASAKKDFDRVVEELADPASACYVVPAIEFKSQTDLTSFELDPELERFRSVDGRVMVSVAGNTKSLKVLRLRQTMGTVKLALTYGGIAKKARLPKAKSAMDRAALRN